jgi:cyanophycinase
MSGRRIIWVLLAAGALLAAPGAAAADRPVRELVPIGGGYEPETLQGFARLAARGAGDGRVDLLVVPSSYGDDPADRAENLALAQGRTDELDAACEAAVAPPCRARLLVLLARADALDPANSAPLRWPAADGVFILGGDQTIAMRVLAGTPAERALAAAYRAGVVVGGTSAGNAVETRTMIAGYTLPGWPYNALERNKVDVWWGDDGDAERGLAFGSRRAVFDQHFFERGRFGRLLNVVAQSDERFGGRSLVGLGVDYGTGARVLGDARAAGIFGLSSAAVIDFEGAGATHAWRGPRRTLSARDVLTHILPPAPGLGYDLRARVPTLGGQPVATPPAPAWDASRLRAPGAGILMLGGDLAISGLPGEALARFARHAAGGPILILSAAFRGAAAAERTLGHYASALRRVGVTGAITRVAYGSAAWDALDDADIDAAGGILLVAGDQSRLAGPLADVRFRAVVRRAVMRAPVTFADGAMAPALGRWYAANADPTNDDYQTVAIDAFRAGDARIRRGLGIVPAAIEPRLTWDQRWGRLYGHVMAHPATLAIGISEATALELGAAGADVVGLRSAIVLDGRAARFLAGSNGALGALGVVLDAFAPGDRLAGGR